MFADSIYHRTAVVLACLLLGLTLLIVRRIAGTVLPLGWLGRWRRLAKDYEQEAMVTLAISGFTASLPPSESVCPRPNVPNGH